MKYRSRRLPTRYRATLAVGDARLGITVLNASGTGARLEGAQLSRGQDVALLVLGQPQSARVVWASGTTAGIVFTRPLAARTLATIAQTRQARIPAATLRHQRRLTEMR